MKQKQVLLTKKGGPEVLEVVEREAPEPGPSEARVKVLATGVAFADVMMRHSLYPGVPNFPFEPSNVLPKASLGLIRKLSFTK